MHDDILCVIMGMATEKEAKYTSRLRVSSLRRGHANLLCIVPILSDDPLLGFCHL